MVTVTLAPVRISYSGGSCLVLGIFLSVQKHDLGWCTIVTQQI
jgi:hypothetical protein